MPDDRDRFQDDSLHPFRGVSLYLFCRSTAHLPIVAFFWDHGDRIDAEQARHLYILEAGNRTAEFGNAIPPAASHCRKNRYPTGRQRDP
jgi:hypothetical protein